MLQTKEKQSYHLLFPNDVITEYETMDRTNHYKKPCSEELHHLPPALPRPHTHTPPPPPDTHTHTHTKQHCLRAISIKNRFKSILLSLYTARSIFKNEDKRRRKIVDIFFCNLVCTGDWSCGIRTHGWLGSGNKNYPNYCASKPMHTNIPMTTYKAIDFIPIIHVKQRYTEGNVLWFSSLKHYYMLLHYLITQKLFKTNLVYFYKANLVNLFLRKQYLQKHTSTIENIGKVNFIKQSLFLLRSVSYFNTIYSDTFKKQISTIPKHWT